MRAEKCELPLSIPCKIMELPRSIPVKNAARLLARSVWCVPIPPSKIFNRKHCCITGQGQCTSWHVRVSVPRGFSVISNSAPQIYSRISTFGLPFKVMWLICAPCQCIKYAVSSREIGVTPQAHELGAHTGEIRSRQFDNTV